MNSWQLIILIVGLVALVVAVGLAVYTFAQQRRTMNRLNAMLDLAEKGVFLESDFDETVLSALETKMAHYLASSEVSAKNLATEKEKIKTLIGDISHQTKTPIANILLYAQILQEHDLPADSKSCVDSLSAQGEKLAFLIESLVKISRLESGVLVMNPQKKSIHPLFEQVARQIAPKAAAKGVELQVEDSDVEACFDGKWTGEAIYNLVDNAVKYTEPGGKIKIKATQYEIFARIDIIDNGMGIIEDEQSKIFGRFYRSPKVSQVEGVGIGLYLVRQIISGQGGYVKVVSSPGQGSTFSVFLPL